MNLLKYVYDSFWHESHWWPPGFNWTTLQNTATERYPQAEELRAPIGYACILLVLRCLFERSISKPIGRWFGLKPSEHDSADLFEQLMNLFITAPKKLITLDPKLAPNVKRSDLDKFSECCFRMTVYLSLFIYGVCTLWNKSWLWNSLEWWYGYPLLTLDSDVHLYYMLELTFYWSLVFSQFFDVHRKDFWVGFIHHAATIALLCFSYTDNFVRGGSIVMLVHDAADPFMEAAKMGRYTTNFKFSNTMYYTFTFVWIITRCVYLPIWIIYPCLTQSVAIIGFYEAYYVFSSLLLMLQVLHIIWTVMIIKILFITLRKGHLEDVRSDDEEDDESEQNSEQKMSSKKSTKRA